MGPASRRVEWGVRTLLAGIAYVPLLLTHRGQIGADTKAYLTLDPSRLLSRVWSLWDPNTGLGTVTHQNIGYLVPMGPWYWAMHAIGVPMWIAQRLWIGTVLAAAGWGIVFLLRQFGWRGPAVLVAALGYELSPYVVQYEARISAILMPWAALPWLLALTIRAIRRGGWRDPAIFALVTTLVGGVNATSLLLVGLAPALWVPFAVWGLKEARPAEAVAAAARIAVLAAATALWWVAGLFIEGSYGLNVLRYTETVPTVASTGTAVEVLRGLGNWFFYGRDALAAWVQPAVDYTQWVLLLAVSVAVPVVAVAAAVVVRFREKLYFVGLVVLGLALGVGVHPYGHPSPLGSLLKAFGNGSTAGLALRSTGRAVPLVALGLAVIAGAAVQAAWDRRPGLGAVLAVTVAALAVADMTPLFIGQFVDDQLQRPSALPAYWQAAASYLDSQGGGPAGYTTRVLEEPGADFLHYRWGATLDPVTPGITDRPYVDRELVPAGSAAGADLIRALDERLQEGVLEPAALAPLARRLSVGDLVLRSDLQWERFRTPRPVQTWPLFSPSPAGLGPPIAFGPVVGDQSSVPFVDEEALATPPGAVEPPSVAVFPVQDPLPILRTESTSQPIVLAGDGEGMVDAAAAGLLNGDNPVLYAGSIDHQAGGYAAAVTPAADLVLTDTNRKRAQRYGSIRGTFGYTQAAGEQPLVADPSNAPLPVFPGAGDGAATVAQESGHGIAMVRASAYGSDVSYDPQSRPDLAVDGNPGTAWTVGAFADPVGQYLRIDLSRPVTTGTVTIQQPYTSHIAPPPGHFADNSPVEVPGQRWINQVRLHFDTGPDVTVALDKRSRSSTGQVVTFPTRTFNWVQLTIMGTGTTTPAGPRPNGVGFSEVRIGSTGPGTEGAPVVDELLRLPTDLLDAVGASNVTHRLTILLTRLQTNPSEPFTGNPEPSIARTFTLPTARTFALGGTAQISALTPDFKLDPLLGRRNDRGMLIANSSGRLPGDLAARSSSALDGDPTTAWVTGRGPQAGNWIRVDLPHPVALDHFQMELVADGRHSVPTRLGVSVDGGPTRVIDLPNLVDRNTAGAVVPVTVSLPGMTAQHLVVVTIEAVRKVTTLDNLSGTQVTQPVAIAELGLPGIREAVAAPDVPSGCRTDLITVDGRPISVRLVGKTAVAGARGAVTLEACTAPLELGAGTHVIRTATGQATGIDVNRLTLSSAAGGGADATLGRADSASTPGSPPVAVLSQSRTSMKARVSPSGAASWLVLGQSDNAGWTARIDGAGGRSLGSPQLIDGYANGWYLPASHVPLVVSVSWAPQHGVDMALVVSVLGVLLCVGLVVGTRRRTATTGPIVLPTAVAPWAAAPRLSPGRSLVVTVGAGVLAAGLVSPGAGAFAALAVAVSCIFRRGRVLLAGAAVALLVVAGTSEVAVEIHHRFPLVLEWPQHFESAGRVAWLGVVLMAGNAIVDRLRSPRTVP